MHTQPVDVDEATWPKRPDGDPATGPLAGLRVLDLTAYAVGPWAASNLSQLGADVVRVDPPYGDPIRAVLPRKNGEPTTYMSTSLGKRSLILDLKDPADHRIAVKLAAAADVVLENSRAGTMDRLGLGYDALSVANPRLIYCSSSSYGDAGPMASMGSTDPQGQAFSGFASGNGTPDGDPQVLRYVALVDLGTSMQLLNAVLIGLVGRRRTGQGQHVRTSQMEAAIGLQVTRFAEYFASGTASGPAGSATRSIVPSRAFRCSDGVWVSVTAHTKATWQALCSILALSDDLVAGWNTNEARVAHRDEVDAVLAKAIGDMPSAWWTQVLPRNGVPCVRLRTLDEKPEEQAHLIHNRVIQRVQHPVGGTLAVSGPMWHFERTPAVLGDPELPGAHTKEILDDLANVTATQRETLPRTTPTADIDGVGRALEGVRVLDLTQGVAGPYCGMLLATLGADVVKVEPPGGDWLRRCGPPFVGGMAATAYQLNRDKRSILLDLEDGADVEVLRRLLRTSDVFLHDMTTATARDRGLDPQALRRLNPALVDCSVTPLGESGPWADLPATELEVQSLGGVWRYLGVVGEAPLRIGADVAGVLGGCAAFQGIMAALAGGEEAIGQHVSTSELAAVMGTNTVMIAALDGPDTWDGFHTNAATYPPDHGISTADGQIYYGQPLRSEQAWVDFCHEIGAEALLEEPLFATRELRMPNQMSLRRALQPYFLRHSTAELVEMVRRSDGIAVPVQDVPSVAVHPQISSLGIIVAAAGIRTLAPPWRALDGSIRAATGLTPEAGADAREILAEQGVPEAEIVRRVGVAPFAVPTINHEGEAS